MFNRAWSLIRKYKKRNKKCQACKYFTKITQLLSKLIKKNFSFIILPKLAVVLDDRLNAPGPLFGPEHFLPLQDRALILTGYLIELYAL